jgi:hypothetical protein
MSIENKLNELISRLAEGPILPGGIREYTNVCGKENCKCKDQVNPQYHGPYRHLSFSVSGKSSTMSIQRKDLKLAKEMTTRFTDVKNLCNQIALEYVDVTREHGVDMAQEVTQKYFANVKGQEISGKTESGKFRDMKVSRNKWKLHAIERRNEIKQAKVKIRDLTASRTKWRDESLVLRKEIEKHKEVIKKLKQDQIEFKHELEECKKKRDKGNKALRI